MPLGKNKIFELKEKIKYPFVIDFSIILSFFGFIFSFTFNGKSFRSQLSLDNFSLNYFEFRKN